MSNATVFKAFSLFALCGFAATAAAQDQRLVVPLSDPGRPARLEITMFQGDIEVRGYDGNEVVVTTDTEVRNASKPETPRSDGLRRIAGSSVGMTVEENGNTVSVRMDFSPHGADLVVQVPRRTSVKASLVNGGDVEIEGVTGEHELSNVNGDVIATDISGSAVMNSNNGEVTASFAQVDASKSMSFTSFNGDVDISLPANLAADFIVASQQGDVYTDFEVVSLTDQVSDESSGDADGRPRRRMQRTTTYAIGGGGADIQFRTFNGDIMIRKR